MVLPPARVMVEESLKTSGMGVAALTAGPSQPAKNSRSYSVNSRARSSASIRWKFGCLMQRDSARTASRMAVVRAAISSGGLVIARRSTPTFYSASRCPVQWVWVEDCP